VQHVVAVGDVSVSPRPGEPRSPLRAGKGQRIMEHPAAVVELVEFVHVFVGQLEIEDVEVFDDPLGFRRARDDRIVELKVPSDEHLRGCAVVFGRDRRHCRVIEQPADPQRAVGLGDHVVLRMGLAKFGLV